MQRFRDQKINFIVWQTWKWTWKWTCSIMTWIVKLRNEYIPKIEWFDLQFTVYTVSGYYTAIIISQRFRVPYFTRLSWQSVKMALLYPTRIYFSVAIDMNVLEKKALVFSFTFWEEISKILIVFCRKPYILQITVIWTLNSV